MDLKTGIMLLISVLIISSISLLLLAVWYVVNYATQQGKCNFNHQKGGW